MWDNYICVSNIKRGRSVDVKLIELAGTGAIVAGHRCECMFRHMFAPICRARGAAATVTPLSPRSVECCLCACAHDAHMRQPPPLRACCDRNRRESVSSAIPALPGVVRSRAHVRAAAATHVWRPTDYSDGFMRFYYRHCAHTTVFRAFVVYQDLRGNLPHRFATSALLAYTWPGKGTPPNTWCGNDPLYETFYN
ncbi:unnamed protein product, partial [Iphiclides podalirius]